MSEIASTRSMLHGAELRRSMYNGGRLYMIGMHSEERISVSMLECAWVVDIFQRSMRDAISVFWNQRPTEDSYYRGLMSRGLAGSRRLVESAEKIQEAPKPWSTLRLKLRLSTHRFVQEWRYRALSLRVFQEAMFANLPSCGLNETAWWTMCLLSRGLEGRAGHRSRRQHTIFPSWLLQQDAAGDQISFESCKYCFSLSRAVIVFISYCHF